MLRRLIAMLSGLLAACGCASSQDESLHVSQPGTFTLKEVDSRPTSGGTLKTWLATSRNVRGNPFTFRIEILMKPPQGDSPFAFSSGAIIRKPGADGTKFLAEVARAIEAEGHVPSKSSREDRIDFSVTILGTGLSRQMGDDVVAGGFTSTKSGDWTALKLFLADGEGEVFLNINPVAGEGEFAPKDPEYGEVVLQELAKVFYP
ncbi:MAG: hypothetical protein JW809_08280 [Pirellulales bacterium]|nr:hypothetical protein [Pirellulales bacterium]